MKTLFRRIRTAISPRGSSRSWSRAIFPVLIARKYSGKSSQPTRRTSTRTHEAPRGASCCIWAKPTQARPTTALERLAQAQNGSISRRCASWRSKNYEKLKRECVPCDLVTGEEELLTEGARHVCSTIEKLDTGRAYDVAVIDEIQMIADSQRGQAWTRALLGLRCGEIHVCGAMNAKDSSSK